MPTANYTANFGTQHGVAYSLEGQYPDTDGTYAIPQGYTVTAQTGLVDNGDGTITITAATWTAAPVVFTPTLGVEHEMTDGAGTAIPANTVDQSSL